MIVKIDDNLQVTIPAQVLDAMGAKPGDLLEITEGPDGFILRPRRIDHSRLGTLRDKIAPGTPPLDIRKFRERRAGRHRSDDASKLRWPQSRQCPSMGDKS